MTIIVQLPLNKQGARHSAVRVKKRVDILILCNCNPPTLWMPTIFLLQILLMPHVTKFLKNGNKQCHGCIIRNTLDKTSDDCNIDLWSVEKDTGFVNQTANVFVGDDPVMREKWVVISDCCPVGVAPWEKGLPKDVFLCFGTAERSSLCRSNWHSTINSLRLWNALHGLNVVGNELSF